MKIDCKDFELFADAYIDGEFAERERVEFETHLESCTACTELVDERIRFKEQFRAALGAPKAPEALKAKIFAELESQAAASRASRAPARRRRRVALLAGPLAAAAALLLLLPAFTIAPASSGTTPIIEQTVDWHRGDFPDEISSSSPKSVTKWFQGRVDFPVRLPHFPTERVKLLGARIAHVEKSRAALVRYEVDGVPMSVMMFHDVDFHVPGDKVEKVAGNHAIALLNSNGYDVAVMQDGGLTYTMTSELPQTRLVEVVEASLKR